MNRRDSLKILCSAAAGSLLAAKLNNSYADSKELLFCSYGETTTSSWKQAAAAPFKRLTGINVEFAEIPNPSAALIGSAGSGTYDLALTTFIDIPNLRRNGAIEEFDAAVFPEAQKLPPRYQLIGENGKVSGAAAFQMWYGITYNKRLAKSDDFKSWSNLANPKWKGRLALNRPQWGAAYDLSILSKATGGDERNVDKAVELYKRIASNAVTAYTSITHMMRLLSRGEIAAGPFYSQETFRMIRTGNADISMVIPDEGALALPYAIVIPKGSKNIEQAKQFLRFVFSQQAALGLANNDPVLPIDPSVKLPDAVVQRIGASAQQIEAKLYQPDWSIVEADWKRRTAICEQVFANRA
ncbi:extracellular solute-binding protein [Caballeronia sp. dw_19]|uniref:extracellular solute-binding protein n=1 Tax=Caballeronia sp. dw_19 TaxID=2719791 RepID=UPI001BCF5009|nr:extracellular solute-binding protein [Caballeronia sp. dw_19]